MKNILILACLIFWSVSAVSQPTTSDYYSGKYKFLGFNFGLTLNNNLTDLNKDFLQNNDSFTSITSSNFPGINLGSFYETQLHDLIWVRLQAALFLTESKLFYHGQNDKLEVDVERIIADVPIHFIFRKEIKDYNPYFYIGPSFKYDFAAHDNLNKLERINIDYAIDFGIGMEKLFPYFILAPELRYSFALRDVSASTDNFINKSTDYLRVHMISLILNFKG